jgi:translation initiation factor 4A
MSSFAEATPEPAAAAAAASSVTEPSEYEVVMSNDAYVFPEIHKWDDLELNDALLRSVFAYGFEYPSDIQKKATKPLKDGLDLIAQAQSGTGKTGSFVIGMLSRIDLASRNTQAILMAPTKLLAEQIFRVARNLSQFMDGISIRLLVGGTSVDEDIRGLKEDRPHVVVGCPGRIYDMLRRRALNHRFVKVCVLDEADQMLSKDFQQEIHKIISILPGNMQIALFSATMQQTVLDLTERFMRNPVKILMKSHEVSLQGIKQYFIGMSSDHDKVDTLKDLFAKISVGQTFIYANSVLRVKELFSLMQEDGFAVCCIHGEMTEEARRGVLQEFKDGKFRVLISSDITARGIDVQQVNVVINYDIPGNVNTYLHRIGRGGRWGRKGVAINFVTRRDIRSMKDIEHHYGITIEEMPADVEL